VSGGEPECTKHTKHPYGESMPRVWVLAMTLEAEGQEGVSRISMLYLHCRVLYVTLGTLCMYVHTCLKDGA
jgi:hypothetical protein